MLFLTACGGTKQEDADKLELKVNVQTACIKLMDSLNSMSGDDLLSAYAYYQNLAETDESAELNLNLLGDYIENRTELGEFVQYGEFTLDEAGKTLTATLPAEYEYGTLNLVYVMNKNTNTVTAINVNRVLSLGETMKKAGMNTLMGIGIVFLILVLISLLIYCFKFISVIENKLKGEEEKKPVPFEKELKEEITEDTQEEDYGELVAVIAAAVAASTGMSTDDFVVRSINRTVRGGR